MNPAPPTTLDALVRAFTALAPKDEATVELIAASLRIQPASLQPARLPPAARIDASQDENTPVAANAPADTAPGPGPARVGRPPQRQRLYRLPDPPEAGWALDLGDTSFLPAPEAAPAPAAEPLLPRRTAAGVIKALVSSSRPDGEVDVAALVRHLAAGRPLLRLPRAGRASLTRGACVILDQGPGLAPFREDAVDLVRALQRVVGVDKLTVRWCAGWPPSLNAEAENEPPWSTTPDTPVLIISDFGLSGARRHEPVAGPAAWAQFADRLAALGHEVVGLAPSQADEWTPQLARAIGLAAWDPSTTARSVRRAREARGRAAEAAALSSKPAERGVQADLLARALSPAVRIDRRLLRGMRRRLMPQSTATLEAELWWDERVASRGEGAVSLDPDQAGRLREALRSDPAQLSAALAQIGDVDRGLGQGLRLEEALIGLALTRSPDWEGGYARQLRSALRTVLEGAEREGADVARWAVNALPRMDLPAGALEAARDLLFASAVKLGRAPASRGPLAARPAPGWLRRLGADGQAPRRRLGLSWTEAGVRLIAPDGCDEALQFRASSPPYTAVHLRGEDDPDGGAWVTEGQRDPVPVSGSEAVIVTDQAGTRWRLEDAAESDARPPLRIMVVMHPDDRTPEVEDALDEMERHVRMAAGLPRAAPVVLQRELARRWLTQAATDYRGRRNSGSISSWRATSQHLIEIATAYIIISGPKLREATRMWEILDRLHEAVGSEMADPGAPGSSVQLLDWRPTTGHVWEGSHDWLNTDTWRPRDQILPAADALVAGWRQGIGAAHGLQRTDRTPPQLAQIFQGLVMAFHSQTLSPRPSDSFDSPDPNLWGLSPVGIFKPGPDDETASDRPRTSSLDFLHIRVQCEYIFSLNLRPYLEGLDDPFIQNPSPTAEGDSLFDPQSPRAGAEVLGVFVRFAPTQMVQEIKNLSGAEDLMDRSAQPQIDEAFRRRPDLLAQVRAYDTSFNNWRMRFPSSLDNSRSFPEYLEGFFGLLNHFLRSAARSQPEMLVGLLHPEWIKAETDMRHRYPWCFDFLNERGRDGDDRDPGMPIDSYADLVADIADDLMREVRLQALDRRRRPVVS